MPHATEQALWQSIAPGIVTGMTGLGGALLGRWLAGVRETRQAKRQDSRDALYLAVTLGAPLWQVVGQCGFPARSRPFRFGAPRAEICAAGYMMATRPPINRGNDDGRQRLLTA
jgi:hypothetical protein